MTQATMKVGRGPVQKDWRTFAKELIETAIETYWHAKRLVHEADDLAEAARQSGRTSESEQEAWDVSFIVADNALRHAEASLVGQIVAYHGAREGELANPETRRFRPCMIVIDEVAYLAVHSPNDPDESPEGGGFLVRTHLVTFPASDIATLN